MNDEEIAKHEAACPDNHDVFKVRSNRAERRRKKFRPLMKESDISLAPVGKDRGTRTAPVRQKEDRPS